MVIHEKDSGETVLLLVLLLAFCLTRVVWYIRSLRQRHSVKILGGLTSLLALILVYALIAVFLLRRPLEIRSSPTTMTAILLLYCALALRRVALRDLGGYYSEMVVVHPQHQVVNEGIYASLRHPLHLTLLIEILAIVMLGGFSGFLAMSCFAIALVVISLRNLLEEALLVESLGEDYGAYLSGEAWDIVDFIPKSIRRRFHAMLSGSRREGREKA